MNEMLIGVRGDLMSVMKVFHFEVVWNLRLALECCEGPVRACACLLVVKLGLYFYYC